MPDTKANSQITFFIKSYYCISFLVRLLCLPPVQAKNFLILSLQSPIDTQFLLRCKTQVTPTTAAFVTAVLSQPQIWNRGHPKNFFSPYTMGQTPATVNSHLSLKLVPGPFCCCYRGQTSQSDFSTFSLPFPLPLQRFLSCREHNQEHWGKNTVILPSRSTLAARASFTPLDLFLADHLAPHSEHNHVLCKLEVRAKLATATPISQQLEGSFSKRAILKKHSIDHPLTRENIHRTWSYI